MLDLVRCLFWSLIIYAIIDDPVHIHEVHAASIMLWTRMSIYPCHQYVNSVLCETVEHLLIVYPKTPDPVQAFLGRLFLKGMRRAPELPLRTRDKVGKAKVGRRHQIGIYSWFDEIDK